MVVDDTEKQLPPRDNTRAILETGNVSEESGQLARKLTPRQVQMISIGGTVGTGLYLGTGRALATGGPASMLLAYSVCGGLVFLTMLSLGEMVAFMPVAGSFCTYAGQFVDDAFGFALTWNYWANDAISTASDLVALQVLLAYWAEHFPGWGLSLICLALVIGLNLCSVRIFGEAEYWLSLLKVMTIIVFIIVGIVVNCGVNPQHAYLGAKYFYMGDAPFVGGIGGFASVFVTASFAYGGTENVAVTAGETRNPSQTYPRVIRNVFWRILLFYIVSIVIISLDVPYNHAGLSSESTATSPFTLVFASAGSTIASSFINSVIMTSALSAANHALFAGSRLLYTLALSGHLPGFLRTSMTRINRFHVPWVAVVVTAIVSTLCFGASKLGAGQLWSWLQNLVGVSNQLSWTAICLTSLRFRAAVRRQNVEHLLPFRNVTYPWGPAVAVVGNLFLVLVQGWSCFSPKFDGVQFVAYYLEIPVMLVLFVGWKIYRRTRLVSLEEMDLVTGRCQPEDAGEDNPASVQTGSPLEVDAWHRRGQTWLEGFKRVGHWIV
ncbi:hypothetical protein ASPACDRAFT_37520 [Aspergillus aculeatus ATCC 16872]|uniref:Amino acid permease/ SLC12A domain-containing protein n=1 Tax=Aspergillus aculeatus (strain ATCC 16872 / CBS 172.66 / WB 5094) TaxID=690307 RepID=A0A1L9WET1_ASPA1|nr:uncharacterized protein ASPACDRAFT_37520 [Aspergillus aculeatus ATCC 16872]OJJ94664.1 hypothetical protein ASPACDRAFT_37520 [Aspergillus aculeatus ATCC 16872]